MTPAARIAAAITVLDDILGGKTAEQALKAWGRASRYAGSKDRAALRDLVFDALRRRASCAAMGGGLHGRGLMIGLGIQQGWDLEDLFDGTGYGPAALTEAEQASVAAPAPLTGPVASDVPEWIFDTLKTDLGDKAVDVMAVMRDRAAVFLRVNQRRTDPEGAIRALSADGITVAHHPDVAGALIVTENARRVQQSKAYTDGLVEVQDASSQKAVMGFEVPVGATVLDYCAGGGGKALAVADRFECAVTAHDISAARMRDIEPRAKRAGVDIAVAGPDQLPGHLFDVVLVDAPCSGSGTWRRNPEAKWALTPQKLQDFASLQRTVLTSAARHLAPGGTLIYMTCAIFAAENADVVAAFVEDHPAFDATDPLHLLPSAQWDGFFCQSLCRRV